MISVPFKRTLLFPVLLFILFTISYTADAQQSNPLMSQNLSSVKIDSLSDQDLMSYKAQIEKSGLSETQLETMALSRGMKKEEIEKLKTRLEKLQYESPKTLSSSSTKDKNAGTLDTSQSVGKQDSVEISRPVSIKEKSTIYGQEFFRNGNIKLFQKANDAKAPDSYVLGIGDELTISVSGYSFYNEVLKIDNRGAINPNRMGPIYLKGLTYQSAKSVINSKFGQFIDLSNNKLTVSLSYSRVISVNVVGEVFAPGTYTVPAINTAFNLLVACGGPNNIGSLRNIQIKRSGKTIRTLDVYQFLTNSGTEQDFFLENNDYVLVGSIGKLVTIAGEVKRPMEYEMLEKETIMDLIRYAGGTTSSSYLENVQIERVDAQKGRILINLNLDSILRTKGDFNLLNGDQILIKSVPSLKTEMVEVNGPVFYPGKFEIASGIPMTVADLIQKAGGLRIESYVDKAYLVRLEKDFTRKYIPVKLSQVIANPSGAENLTLQKFDRLEIYETSSLKQYFNVSIEGEVKTPKQIRYYDGMTLSDAIFLAGGLKIEADNLIEISRIVFNNNPDKDSDAVKTIIKQIQLNNDAAAADEQMTMPLQPLDNVFVRTIPNFSVQKNITVRGEVRYPGTYSLISKEERVADIIRRAGGLTTFAFPEAAKIYRKNLDGTYIVMDLRRALRNDNSKFNYIMKEGDELDISPVIDFIGIRGSATGLLEINDKRQINAPYTPGKRANYYINEYGNGFSENAWKRRTYIIQPNNKISKTRRFFFINVYPRVRKGSVINIVQKPGKAVKEKGKPVDWNQLIERTTIKVTGVITVYILLSQLSK